MSRLRQTLERLFRGKQRQYPGEPSGLSGASLEQLSKRMDILQEQIGIILGRRGDVLDQHVAVKDLLDLGLIGRRQTSEGAAEVLVYSAVVNGTGAVHDDINVMDFSANAQASGLSLKIATNAVVTFAHNNNAYLWVGPNGVTVGLGGTHSAVAADLVPVGTADHAVTVQREVEDQHPQKAITNLVPDQETQDSRLVALEAHPPRVDNPHKVTHAQLPDKGANDHAAIDTHLSDNSNPHSTTHAQVSASPDAAHVPSGGTTNQVLAKVSGTDHDTKWQDNAVNSIGEEVPGTGNVWDDINAHCFDGYWSDGACRICIGPNDIAWFGHNGLLYKWFGPSEICLGSGGVGGAYPHHTAVEDDLYPIGTTDHGSLSNRELADQHPQAAITDLVTDQSTQDSRLAALETHPPRTDNPHGVTHLQLPDRGAYDHALIDAHLSDSNNPHGTTHDKLPDKGVNDHAAIDSHIADSLIHFQDVPLDGAGYVRRDRAWETVTNLAILYSNPQNQSLGGGGFRLSNWGGSIDAGLMAGAANAATGGILIPEDGFYRFDFHIHGNQGNNNKEESIWAEVEVVGGSDPGIFEVAHESVDTDKTSSRTLNASWVGFEYAGSTIYIRMRASTGLGTFSFVATQFSITKLL